MRRFSDRANSLATSCLCALCAGPREGRLGRPDAGSRLGQASGVEERWRGRHKRRKHRVARLHRVPGPQVNPQHPAGQRGRHDVSIVDAGPALVIERDGQPPAIDRRDIDRLGPRQHRHDKRADHHDADRTPYRQPSPACRLHGPLLFAKRASLSCYSRVFSTSTRSR